MAAIPEPPFPVLVNGAPLRSLDVADRGLQYGDGVFTTLPAQGGRPRFLGRHLARLAADAARLGIAAPPARVLADEIRVLAAGRPACVVKAVLTAGAGGRGYRRPEPPSATRIVSVHPCPDHPPSLLQEGVDMRLCELRLGLNPRLAGVKHLNRLEQVLARAEWGGEPREGVLLDCEGFVVEGVMSNLFLARGGRLLTPRLDRCGVAGVARGAVLDLARRAGMAAEEARVLPGDLFEADEVFLTNSVIGVWPARALDGRAIPLGGIAPWLAGRLDALAAEEAGP